MKNIKVHFETELIKSGILMDQKDFPGAWKHLENAHVLSQSYAILHFRSHLAMLKYGIYKKDIKEISGQVIRLIFAVLSSLFGFAPTGNTGGANVSMFRKIPIPEELQEILGK